MFRSRLADRRRDERGVVLPLVAIFSVVMIAALGLAIDVGNIAQRNRHLQKVADAAALDSSRVLDGSGAAAIADAVCDAAVASAARNSFSATGCGGPALTVELGTWDTRSLTFTVIPKTSSLVPNAVHVTASENISYFFSAGNQTDSRSATAEQLPTAGVQVGTFVEAAGSPLFCPVADALAPSGTGCVSSGGYTSLAAAHVSVADMARVGSYGTADNLLSSPIGFLQLQSMIAALDPADAGTVFQMHPTRNKSIQLGTQLLVGFHGNPTAASAQLDVLDLLLGGAQIADGGSAIPGPIPLPGVSFPGLTSVSMTVNAIQAPAFVWGPVGATATTSQVDVTLNLTLGGLSVSVDVVGASATASLAQITCANPASQSSVQILGTNTILRATVNPSGQTVDITNIPPPGQPLIFYPLGQPPTGPQTIGSPSDLANAIGGPLGPVLQATLDPLMQALGVQVGQAEIGSPWPTTPATICGGPTLVQ